MSEINISGRTASPAMRAWRVTTAARAFVAALVIGQAISNASLHVQGPTVFALVVLAVALCAVELDSAQGVSRWTPVVEGILAATILSAAGPSSSVLLGYMAIPPVVAGLRHGWVATLNCALTTGIALAAGYLTIGGSDSIAVQLQASLPWLAAGVGTGLLAAWLTRSVRAIEAAQAPYLAAHRLISQLRDLSHRLPFELDSQSVAERLLREVVTATGVPLAVLCVRQAGSSLQAIAHSGAGVADEHVTTLAARSLSSRRQERTGDTVALPVRIGDQAYGVVAITSVGEHADLDAVQSLIDEHALGLDTALVFEEVRTRAAADERGRLSREIHDGVAQEVAALGYLVDDLKLTTSDPDTRQAAERLRTAITGVVSELRLSIFDLRHDLEDAGGLAGALSEYVAEISRHSDLAVHLSLDERRTLSPQVRTELLRIGQEAIANVRRHAQATNLWVTLRMERGAVVLEVADDGVGGATTTPGHYGLSTMRERAHSIQATLDVSTRPDGGTVVTIRTATTAVPEDEGVADAHDTARR